MTCPSDRSSDRMSPTCSFIGMTRSSRGFAGSGFFARGLAIGRLGRISGISDSYGWYLVVKRDTVRPLRGGRTVPDDPLVRQEAREAIRAGRLPTRSYDRIFGGPGSEQPCAVCGKTLPPTEMEVELEFNCHGAIPGIDQFHFH